MSSNQTHKFSTHGSFNHCQAAAATPPRSNTLDYPSLTQLPIPQPSDSAQNRGREVFNQLSSALQHLKSSMQTNKTPH